MAEEEMVGGKEGKAENSDESGGVSQWIKECDH